MRILLSLLCLLVADGPAWQPLFDGKDLGGWKIRRPNAPATWKVVSEVHLDPKNPKKLVASGEGGKPDAILLRMDLGPGEAGSDIFTEKTYGDCKVHLEFLLPKGSNSGLFLQGQYEMQICDSFGLPMSKMGEGECGGIPWTAKPKVNACRRPGEWQTLDVEFLAPRFDAGGKKIRNAKVVRLQTNGQTTIENFELPGPTGSELDGGERASGPILLQAEEGVVAFRNVRVLPLEQK